ncbi:MAG TPA: YggS family pyridoxal phosphate-dependent enzyme, partial [Burkholderiales bacterium]|nr:YggS family pyridoxal phosphate-dependent enzyme [Burkholderiales bacterium]
TVPAGRIAEAYRCGQRAFGENYVQEALAKMDALRDLPLEWHYIGPIQSNKTRAIAERFHWVHSIDRVKIAQRLAAARPAGMPPLDVCIQLNVSGEASKGGVAPGEELELARAIALLPQLRLRGLMAIPEPTDDDRLQRERYASVRCARDALAAAGYALDTLSMGMSDDLEAAIAEGATMVRVGTAIFGARK